MAVNLTKICADLSHPDPQIKTFALMSITRLSPQIVDAPDEIRLIAERLKPLSASDNPDVVFLARKAFNHIGSQFREALEPAGARPAQPAADPQAAPPPAASPAAEAPIPVALDPPGVPAAAPPAEVPTARPPPVAAPPAPVERAHPSSLTRDQLLKVLREPGTDPTYLASALIQIATKSNASDLAAVAPMLKHENDRVRANAIEVFERLGDSSHISLLVPLLQDPNNRARGNAVLALSRMGYEQLETTVKSMLEHSTMAMRETGVYVLSRLDRPFVEPLLLRALGDPYEGVRMRATKALARFPTKETVTALKRTLNDLDINICEAAAESLRSIKGLLQNQRAAHAAAASAATEPSAEGARTAPAEPAPASRAPAPAPARAGSETLEDLQRNLGTEIYQLCRLNAITHESLDTIFYEVLRYQDFLRNYMVKRGDPEDETRKSAIEHLQEKIKAAFTLLGEKAAELMRQKQLTISGEEVESITRLFDQIEKARAGISS